MASTSCWKEENSSLISQGLKDLLKALLGMRRDRNRNWGAWLSAPYSQAQLHHTVFTCAVDDYGCGGRVGRETLGRGGIRRSERQRMG